MKLNIGHIGHIGRLSWQHAGHYKVKYISSDSPLLPKLIAVNLRCCLSKRKHHKSILPLDGYVEVEDCSRTGFEHFTSRCVRSL